jgi:hypothetical protein
MTPERVLGESVDCTRHCISAPLQVWGRLHSATDPLGQHRRRSASPEDVHLRTYERHDGLSCLYQAALYPIVSLRSYAWLIRIKYAVPED